MQTLERIDAVAFRAIIAGFADVVRSHADDLNRLNVYPVPDGDTGTNMSRTLDAVVAEMNEAPAEMAPSCKAVSHGSLMGARGNSGVILSQILRGLSGVFAASDVVDGDTVARALTAASAAAYEAVGRPIEGTILTVVRESAEGATVAVTAGDGLTSVLDAARASARSALERTPDLLPVLKAAGVVDAGGAGFVLFFDAALHVVDGRSLPEPDLAAHPVQPVSAHQDVRSMAHEQDGEDVSDLRYEVMYFLDLPDDLIDTFKAGWRGIGDSIVVVGGDGIWNCHVHTNDVGAAIEVALDAGGRPRKIRVTDLFEEVATEHAAREAAVRGVSHASTAGLPAVTSAVVAVSSGSGLTEMFGALGVQGVVGGGQSANPSTAELLAAVEAVNAHQVVILPNNKNIIPVAEQLAALTSKQVVVVPTRSMPEALAALVVYDPEDGCGANLAAMTAAAEATHTGEITQAVRDTSSPAGPVTTGDWIGLVRGDGIVSIGGSMTSAARLLLDHLVTPDREIVTIITGADAKRKCTDELVMWLAENHPKVEIEVHSGGQALYPYLFGVE